MTDTYVYKYIVIVMVVIVLEQELRKMMHCFDSCFS